jgi:2-dehydropantoate 2-reductase
LTEEYNHVSWCRILLNLEKIAMSLFARLAQPQLHIIGTGAMACLFGARLASVVNVTMVGTWPEGLAALRAHGITVDGEGTALIQTAHLADSLPPADFALVLVKAWQTPTVAAHLPSLLKADGLALTLQNGIGNWELLTGALGAKRAWPGVTTQGATLLGPAHVREGGRGFTHLPDHPHLTPLAHLLRTAGFDVSQSPISELHSLLWGKLVVNCGINAITALLRLPNGELLNRPEAIYLMERAAQECAAVAEASGISLPFASAAERVREVARATASNHSSMFQDIGRGAPTEIDAINGAVTRVGAQRGVPTPVNEILWRLVKALLPNVRAEAD